MQQRKFSRIVVAMAGVIAICLFVSVARSQDDKKPSPEEMQKQMEMMMKAGQPGPEHAKLAEMAGDWDADVTFYSPMGEQKSKGTMHNEMIFGGRVLQMKFDGNMAMGPGQQMPFHGLGLSGYDNTEKKFWNFWTDDTGTGCMITKGTAQGNVVTSEGEMIDPASGKAVKVREVGTLTDKDHQKFEMFCTEQGGKEMKVMEILYTRKA